MTDLTLIGFGEAAICFAAAAGWNERAKVFDIAAAGELFASSPKQRDFAGARVSAFPSTAAAVAGAGIILSLVTADQALEAAQAASRSLVAGSYYFDMNSVAPGTKRAAADAIRGAGGHYIDVAIMAPVHPAALDVPLLLAGPEAAHMVTQLAALGFTNVNVVGEEVGRAAAIKMIRSVMVKGIEALNAEMMLAAQKAGVADAVLAALGPNAAAKADYDLERMRTHGRRRAAEMEEAAKTLAALGIEPVMTRGTILRQREMAS